MTKEQRTRLFAHDVITKGDFLALLDELVEQGSGPRPFTNHRMHRYVGVIAGAIQGRQYSVEVLRSYDECSWRHFAEILASASTRD